MKQDKLIVFVCEHGAAKSIIAAVYFNRLAQEAGLPWQAIARGTKPDRELSPETVKGLSKDRLAPAESVPRKLTKADLQSAQRVITFCELPVEPQKVIVEFWNGIPPVSENYEMARDAIVEHINSLISQIR